MDISNTTQPQAYGPLMKADALLIQIKSSRARMQEVIGRTLTEAMALMDDVRKDDPSAVLAGVDTETSVVLDDTLLNYVEDLEGNGEDFSGLADQK